MSGRHAGRYSWWEDYLLPILVLIGIATGLALYGLSLA
jgi:hypothetical protein